MAIQINSVLPFFWKTFSAENGSRTTSFLTAGLALLGGTFIKGPLSIVKIVVQQDRSHSLNKLHFIECPDLFWSEKTIRSEWNGIRRLTQWAEVGQVLVKLA